MSHISVTPADVGDTTISMKLDRPIGKEAQKFLMLAARLCGPNLFMGIRFDNEQRLLTVELDDVLVKAGKKLRLGWDISKMLEGVLRRNTDLDN